jgi:trehalose 6-phosphate synthase
MEAALIVNPYDLDQTAAAMATALAMGRAERRARHDDLMAGLRVQDVAWWSRAFLDKLSAVPRWQMDTPREG